MAALQARISTAFGPDVMALEADGTEVRGAGSQLGWLLWAGALERLGEAPELFAVTRTGELEPILANRRQAWTVGARWALANRWEGRFKRSTQAA